VFTGIVEELGTVEAITPRGAGHRIVLRAPRVAAQAKPGDSIAVNGICLTVAELASAGFEADASPETLERTSLRALRAGCLVNLEQALKPDSRLGGHIVQGHVDATGTIAAIDALGDGHRRLSVRYPAELERYLAYKGSVAVDGISLTIASLGGGAFSAAVIPHTWAHTNLRARRPGDTVNLETDVLAKYVEKLLATLELPRGGLTLSALREQGL
jgi:riboflavin synthase